MVIMQGKTCGTGHQAIYSNGDRLGWSFLALVCISKKYQRSRSNLRHLIASRNESFVRKVQQLFPFLLESHLMQQCTNHIIKHNIFMFIGSCAHSDQSFNALCIKYKPKAQTHFCTSIKHRQKYVIQKCSDFEEEENICVIFVPRIKHRKRLNDFFLLKFSWGLQREKTKTKLLFFSSEIES